MKRTYLLFSIVVAIALLLAASGLRATGDCPPTPLPSPGVATPPRDCTISISSDKTVKIVAGPGSGSDGLATNFPIPQKCPDGITDCLKWEYQWTFTNITPTEALVSVDSDITVLAS